MNEARYDDAERAMAEVVEIAPRLMFLSNDEVSKLAKRLRAAGRAIRLCDEFDALTRKRDWRLLSDP